ncbi:phytanoyl-CoA dioxygenase family protein [Pseudemcibacter aquimaris]|uniref:phytanoyl-CoA dioxygenase family protein n=1 Tax=Pseudemcibacter aquimaris TaxID=2857064 RepID=UPI0020139277|nr:phytanoyl-CoA dioxygenase family protein [Pseudemcibacter aquimaris]MCC3860321.1 phytanoyl-CoA dioxygenase family protein [Pseudemcibacter aquimaris]WDU57647.1 phytanoyl-CoA dioxygenase family protein [Pseudemcibacter aquimaris]
MSKKDIITEQHIKNFADDGVVLIKGLFADWVDVLRAGIERNMNNPGPEHHQYISDDEQGGFFGDYCNWQRIPEYTKAIEQSNAGMAAANLLRSKNIQVFHEHVLVKEPGTSMATPWHQDSPYYFIEGNQTVSFWCPLDPVKEAALRCVAGSHKWEKPVMPMRWTSGDGFFPNEEDYIPVPDPDSDPEKYKVLEWEMEPGDVIAFNYKTLHGSRGNTSKNRRRAFSLRLFGDDAKYVERPGPCSPPFTGHGMSEGDQLDKELFPVIYKA